MVHHILKYIPKKFLQASVIVVLCILMPSIDAARPLKVLHMSFHKGCIREVKYIARQLGLDLQSVYVQDDWVKFNDYDGITRGNAIYNVSHQRARDVWKRHKKFFKQFDVIMTSDTVPLCRIFLQNGWKKPLIVWMCNRFDYTDWFSSTQGFPDAEYFQLLKKATKQSNVYFVAYNEFEHVYGKLRGIDFGTAIITPSGKFKNKAKNSMVPAHINKAETFFIPPRNNDVQLVDECERLGIPCYRGVYNGPTDLQGFRGIIHVPYAWSNLALFENVQLGLPYFIPTKRFMLELLSTGKAWWPNGEYMHEYAQVSEWYNPANAQWFVFFDSWDDLKTKIDVTNIETQKIRMLQYGRQHDDHVLAQWKELFTAISRKV